MCIRNIIAFTVVLITNVSLGSYSFVFKVCDLIEMSRQIQQYFTDPDLLSCLKRSFLFQNHIKMFTISSNILIIFNI